MILWRLAVVMAERDITNKELASRIGKHPHSVSRLKQHRCLPRINKSLLDSLCKALKCQSGDLIVYQEDEIDR